jgi:hypothetical protein
VQTQAGTREYRLRMKAVSTSALTVFAIVLALSLGLVIASVRVARSENLYWLHVSSRLSFRLAPPVDQTLNLKSATFFAHPCELARLEACKEWFYESSAVHLLRDAHISAVADEFLSRNRYSSAYHLLKDLAIEGHHSDVVVVTAHPLFTRDWEASSQLLLFAKDWYLIPALQYAVSAREQDAVKAFGYFAGISDHVVRSGHWISQKGVDLTDLPVLALAFCNQADPLKRNLCVLGLVKAVARGLLLTSDSIVWKRSMDAISHIGDSLWTGDLRIAKPYQSLPRILRNEALAVYLLAAEEVDKARPDTYKTLLEEPEILGPSARLTWYYLRGRMALSLARASRAAGECSFWIDAARLDLQRLMATEASSSPLRKAADEKLQSLGEVCE